MKKECNVLSRRKFTRLALVGGAALPLTGLAHPMSLLSNTPAAALEVHVFSKHLQFLDYNAMAEAAAEMGFAGLDLTVRPKGHVLPEHVTNDLPKATAAVKKFGLLPRMITTNITAAEERQDKLVLKTASELGYTHYRTGWLKYPEDSTIAASQAIYGEQFKTLEVFNKELGLIGGYQNHAGNHVGAPIWDLPSILETTSNQHIGCQYDIRHAVVEGGASWELGLRRIAPFIKSVVIKDFKWGKVNGVWKPVNTPLGLGMVNFKRYFSLLKQYKINVPVSLHLEYDLGGAEHGASKITMPKEQIFALMKKDLKFIQDTWKNAE